MWLKLPRSDLIGLNQLDYSNEWILKGLRKRKANYSMVICFETWDPTRIEQLKKFFCNPPEQIREEYEDHRIYIYDSWDGLNRIEKMTGELKPVTVETKSGLQQELDGKIRDLVQCLNIMDSTLKKYNTIFIIHGLILDKEVGILDKERSYLLSALRKWALSKDLIRTNSIVILIGGNSSSLLNEELRNLIAVTDVEIATDAEYLNLINYLDGIFQAHLDDKCKQLCLLAVKGLNLHQAEAILRESYTIKRTFDLEEIKTLKGELVKKSGVLEIEDPKEGFEAIGGYNEVKMFIREKIVNVLQNQYRAKKFAIPLPRGILFFGPPGTGKTLFAKALAKKIQLPFINMRTENIYSKWLGETGQRIRDAVKIAEQMSPGIVFIDEIDRFGRRTSASDSASEETRRAFSQLLEWLGNPNRRAIIVGTTNKPEHLDEAFIRTGRFDYKIPILYPDSAARLDILRVHLGIPDKNGENSKPRLPLEMSEQDFMHFINNEVVPKTENYTGAELEELVTRAKRSAFERNAEKIGTIDFEKSLKSFRINYEERKNQLETYWKLAEKFTDDAVFLANITNKI
jgi:SpoVK/Ycf46/Vps4 family AAA+-type ATPase